jgi:hypothetical protein
MFKHSQLTEDSRLVTTMIARLNIDYFPTANSGTGRGYAQDKTIAPGHDDRTAQAQLYPRILTRLQLVYVEEPYARGYLLRSTVKVYQGVMPQGASRIGEQRDMRINQKSCAQLPRQANDVATCQVTAGNIGQVDSNPAARLDYVNGMLVCLQATNARSQPLG